jgi:Ca-activated chloride channel family protein
VTFESPFLIVVAALVPVVIVLIAVLDRSRRRALLGRLGEVAAVQRMMASASPARRRIKRVLQAAGLALIVLAAARPQLPGRATRGTASLDLVVALDVSKSMLVDDLGGTRLDRARALVRSLFDELPDDRVAPVVFAGAAAHFPLTGDKDVAAEIMSDLGPADLPPGSDLVEALRVSKCLLRPDLGDSWDDDCGSVGGRGHGGDPLPGETYDEDGFEAATDPVETEERAKVILLITDGADGLRGGRRDDGTRLLAEIRDAVELGITVLVVGAGTDDGGAVPELDYRGRPVGQKRDEGGNVVVSKLDAASLRLLAEAGGDAKRYVTLADLPFENGRVDPTPVVAALGALKRGALERRDERVMDELYHFFLLPGFLLLVAEACVGTRRRIRHPEG